MIKEFRRLKKSVKIVIISLLIGFILLATATFGKSYAYFSAAISETNEANQKVAVSTANITVEYDAGTSEINAGGINPGWSETKTFTVTNHNNVVEYYNIVWKEVMNTFENNTDILYKIDGPAEKNETIAPLGDGAILVNIEIDPKETHEYTFTIWYKNRGQVKEEDAIFYGHIKITKDGEEVRNDGVANEEAIKELIKIERENSNPVGSIIITTASTNPSEYMGFGEWVQWGSGQVLTGVDTSQSEFNTVEKSGGAKSYSLTASQLPGHTHTIPALSGTAASAGAHTHGFSLGGQAVTVANSTSSGLDYTSGFYPITGQGWWSNSNKGQSTISSAGAHTHNVTTTASTTGSTGSSAEYNVVQPYITAYMWKRIS